MRRIRTMMGVSSMYDQADITKHLINTFDLSALSLFHDFLAVRPLHNDWIVASDYCLHRPWPAGCFAFSLIPFDDQISSIKEEIHCFLPHHLKAITTVSPEALDFLRNPRRFHICFRLNKKRVFFTNG